MNKWKRISKEPKPPTHEEIMTLWWESSLAEETTWWRVTEYRSDFPMQEGREYCYFIDGGNKKKSWFIGRKSATIPHEQLI